MASYESLKGKTYIVTGAASGMGRAISRHLAQQGANVGLVDLYKPDEVLKDVERLGGQGISLAANVQDATAINTAFRAVVDKFGRLDGAANMAGTVGSMKIGDTNLAVAEITDSDWDFLLGTNLNGIKNSIRAELQLMKGSGSIVNAASIAAQVPTPFNSPYGVAKAGVVSITKTVAQEVGRRNIRVNSVAPSYVKSGLTKQLGNEEFLMEKVVKPHVALQRMAEPEEVADLALFLLSDQSSFITGTVSSPRRIKLEASLKDLRRIDSLT